MTGNKNSGDHDDREHEEAGGDLDHDHWEEAHGNGGDKKLASIFLDAGIDEAMDKINQTLESLGQEFRVESLSFTKDLEARSCRCTARGVTGYTERCVTRNGQRSCTRVATYGCTNWDCT